MPYIPQSERKQFNKGLILLTPKTKGQLTYCLYNLVLDYMHRHSPLSYAEISNTLSALTNAEHELCRRTLDPYEDEKRKEHGDI